MGVACETGSTGVRWPSASLVMCGQSRQDGREPMVSLRISCENYTATRAQEGGSREVEFWYAVAVFTPNTTPNRSFNNSTAVLMPWHTHQTHHSVKPCQTGIASQRLTTARCRCTGIPSCRSTTCRTQTRNGNRCLGLNRAATDEIYSD